MNLSKEEILKQSLPILKLLEVSSCQLISFVQVSLKYGGVPRDHTNLGYSSFQNFVQYIKGMPHTHKLNTNFLFYKPLEFTKS